tara:strand:+ start:100 stop:372 length:273 start_codon:yes stop_codon:yes gene_type:complete
MEVNDEKLIDLAMYNAYYVLTGKSNESDIIAKDKGSFFYNPLNGRKSLYENIDDVIDYMEGLEEYEKCAELRDIKNELLISKESEIKKSK